MVLVTPESFELGLTVQVGMSRGLEQGNACD